MTGRPAEEGRRNRRSVLTPESIPPYYRSMNLSVFRQSIAFPRIGLSIGLLLWLSPVFLLDCRNEEPTWGGNDPNSFVSEPKEIDDVLPNPGIGFTTHGSYDGKVQGYPRSRVAYFRWYWKDLEPQQGNYQWSLIDNVITRARDAGQTLALRVMPADGEPKAPQWFRDLGAPGMEFTAENPVGGQTSWMPDHSDSLYLHHQGNLVRELAARYDGHPDIDHVDIGSCGHWGEWHMSFVDGMDMPSLEVKKQIIDWYLESFRETPLVMLIGDVDGMKYATANGAGWRADCLGDYGYFSDTWNHMDNLYQQNLNQAQANDAWRRAPVCFESCGTMQTWQDMGFDVRKTFDEALRWHASIFNNKSSAVPAGWMPYVDDFLRKIGYRLTLRKLSHARRALPGGKLSIAMEWENVGVAPPYRHYKLAFELRKTAFKKYYETGVDMHLWLPGKHTAQVELPLHPDLEPDTYEVYLAWIDPATDEPAIRLAMEGVTSFHWYLVSQLIVE
ncbi:DUF4832 domain-containing protein [candidate division KSB1 bacterium]